MTNNYLYIEGSKWEYCDGVFSGTATLSDYDCVVAYCHENAEGMRHSKLGNYACFRKKKRERLAELWEAAKDLPNGKYDYYFNFESKDKIFKQKVKELATRLNINYKLIIK